MGTVTVGRWSSALAAMAALALTGAGSSAAVSIGCGQEVTVDTTLTADLVGCPADGVTVDQGVTLNLNRHTISGTGTGTGVRGGTVLNGTIQGFEIGVDAALAVRNMTVSENQVGVRFPSARGLDAVRRLVQGSNVARNTDVGILLDVDARNVDVDNNHVQRNGGDGIAALLDADGGTYTDNLVRGNGRYGINIRQSFSRVVGNTVSDNGADGIHMSDDVVPGTAYFIADNTANGNAGLGIWTMIFCAPGACNPPTMTDGGGNVASRNADPAQCVNIVCARNRRQT